MNGYNKQLAMDLYRELQEVLAGTPKRIEQADDDGPVIAITCEGLGKAIAALRTTVR